MPENMSKVIMMVGFQASTKSTYVYKLVEENPRYIVLSRDTDGGSVQDLIPKYQEAIQNNNTIILDNTHLTKESRKMFIDIAAKNNCTIEAIYIKSTIEDCQIRALRRMCNTHGGIYLTGKPGVKDPHVFPPAVLFAARKNLEVPDIAEGFSRFTTVEADKIIWDPSIYKRKALFLDIDGTIRATEHLPHKYPTEIDEVVLLHDVTKIRDKLDKYRAQGFKLIGVSNQSGIAKGILTKGRAVELFNKTRELLGYSEKEFPILFCPHNSAPISCYCRKPQSGLAVQAIEEWKLQPSRCVMVGDMKTDETFAKRIGFKFVSTSVFWSY